MSFLVPAAFAGLAVAIPILLLYMLRLRRRELLVSSTYLWRQVLKDTEANTPWQRLRRNLLLFLQLLILLAMVLALTRPFITVPTVSAGKIALLLDASASMRARDIDGKSRFEAAVEQARGIIDSMNPQDAISIIRVADIAEALSAYSDDKAELRRALDEMQVSQGSADWDRALTLAAAGSAGAENFSIVMISDGGIGAVGGLPANIPQPIYVPVGESGANVAITALATRALAGQAPQLFAQVTNYGESAADISLVIRLDGVLRLSRSGRIPPRSQLPIPFDEAIGDSFETLSAALTFDSEVEDYLELDNRAWAVHKERNTRRVYYVSESGNLFLEQALRSLPGLQTFRGDPANRRAPGQNFDLYVFDGWLPDRLPDADMLIVNPPHSTGLFSVGATVEATANIEIGPGESSITAFVDLDEMSLLAFRELGADWARSLVSAAGGDLLVAGEVNARQIAILPFDLRDSNLPLLIAWPVLMANLLDWFSPAEIVSLPDGLSVGDPLVIQPPLNADGVRVTMPDGGVVELSARGDALIFSDTSQLGLYLLEIVAGGEVKQSQAFAVNLFGTGESDIGPVPEEELALGGGEASFLGEEQLGLREYWTLAALLALGLLVIEWVVYHRRSMAPTLLGSSGRRMRLPFMRSSSA